MSIARGGIGNFWVRGESALGTGTGTWYSVRTVEPPDLPTNTRMLAAAGVAGHRNPLEIDKPVAYEIGRDGEIKFALRIHRASATGAEPQLMTLLKSCGWSVQTSTSATTSTAASTTTSIVQQTGEDITNGTSGEAVLIEDDTASPTLYRPALMSSISTNTITLAHALPNAPGDTDVIEQMSTACPTTATSYQVPTDKTVQFRLNTWGEDDDAAGDLSFVYAGCALSTVDEISFEGVGSIPQVGMSFHCCDVAKTSNDIAADSFTDSAPFAVINDDCEFMFAAASTSGAIARVAKSIVSCKFNLGITVNRVPGHGGDADLNGTQAYQLIQGPPTCTVTAIWQDDAAFEDLWLTDLEGTINSRYIHFIQPSRSLAGPAFGIWMSSCHFSPEAPPTIDWKSGDTIQATATFVGSTAGYNSETDIDDYGSCPIYIAVSGEAS